jgi:hypothetical protein
VKNSGEAAAMMMVMRSVDEYFMRKFEREPLDEFDVDSSQKFSLLFSLQQFIIHI